MNKKQTERILIGVVAAILVLYGIYQVAYGTNDSSYRFGFSGTYTDYKCVKTEGCDEPSSRTGDIMSACTYHTTNITACIDGTVNGWKAWCKSDLNNCLDNVLWGLFPDIHNILWDSTTGNLTDGLTWVSYNSTTGSTGTVIFKHVGVNHIVMKDGHGNIIHLMRWGLLNDMNNMNPKTHDYEHCNGHISTPDLGQTCLP